MFFDASSKKKKIDRFYLVNLLQLDIATRKKRMISLLQIVCDGHHAVEGYSQDEVRVGGNVAGETAKNRKVSI